MKTRLPTTIHGALFILCAATITTHAQVTGLRQHQVIPLAIGAGEVVGFSPNQDTLAVTNDSIGGVSLLRHNGTEFVAHAEVNIAKWFTDNPVTGFIYSEITGVAIDAGSSGIGVANILNGSTVTVTVNGAPMDLTASIPQIGRAVFFNMETGAVIGSVPVGYHPDAVAISNGIVGIANEGQHAWTGDEDIPSTVADFDAYQQPGSVSVINLGTLNAATLGAALGSLTVDTIDFSGVPGLIAGVRDHTSFDPADTKPKYFHIEPEYVVFSPDNTQLIVSLQENNALAVLDLATLSWDNVTSLGQTPIVIDASDRDAVFDVTNPAFGLPMPDGIATWKQGDKTYVITADEGDARVDDGDIRRFRSAATAFGLAEGFTPSTDNNDYGRLKVVIDQILNGPVSDPASRIDKIVSLGTRGLSLWEKADNGAMTFVSHLPLETELFNRDPQRHNSNRGGIKGTFDTRSDDKGPEPEGVAVTTLPDGTVIAVAVMERQNGVIVVDVTDPAAPQVVRYINDSDAGLISPETVTIVDAADSPTGNALAIVGYEGVVSSGIVGGVGVYEINPASFRLQVLHASDMEGSISSITTAPQFAALVDKLEHSPGMNASVTIGAGDCFIPGAFLSAGNDFSTRVPLKSSLGFAFGYDASVVDLRENPGRPNVAIMNAIGFDATCIGNHEFDLGANEFANIVLPDARTSRTNMRHYGAAFPFLSANLDFSGDSTLNARYTSEIRSTAAFAPHAWENYPGINATPTRAKIAKSAIIQRGGEKIGVIGVTPPDLASISSPGLVTVTGPQGAVSVSPRTYDLDALAAHIQPSIDALVAAGCNKIIMASHLQQLDNEKQLAAKLRHVDIIIAGGSGVIMAKPETVLQPGDSIGEGYPFTTTDLDGRTVAVVSGEGEYEYLGRLVVDFNNEGHITGIDTVSNSITVNDAAVTAEWGVADPYAAGTRGGAVKAMTDVIGTVISAKDGLILGKSAVYLEGRRTSVRQQETNFGNLSADANLWYAKQSDSTVEVALKNGGGIRNAIGAIDTNGNLLPTAANPSAGKVAGDISQLDLEDSLKFNNGLTALSATVEQLKVLLEHGVQGSNGTGFDKSTPGQFAQLGGIRVVADLARTPISYSSTDNVITSINGGERIRYAALLDEAGAVTELLIANGQILNPGRQVRLVTLNFLANAGSAGSDFGGDNYPLPWVVRTNPSANRVDLSVDATANQATFAAAGSEQDAFAEFMLAFHSSSPFNKADTTVDLDRRIIQGLFDSDGDGFTNGFEVATLGLNPDVANSGSEIDAVLDGIRTAGRADVTSNPSAFSLYTASSIQDLRGTGNLLIQASGANVTLTLPLQKSTTLDNWEPAAANLEATFQKTEGKEFYRLTLPQ